MNRFKPQAVISVWLSLAALCLCCVTAAWAASITIKVNAGERKTFQGFGYCLDEPTAADANQWPEEERLKLARILWQEADFRFIRCWAHEQGGSLQSWTDEVGNNTKPYVDEIRGLQPNLVVLLAPTDRSHRSAQDHANFYLQMIGKLRDEYDFKIDVTGVCNEPNVPGRFSPAETATLVNLFRKGLDDLGMQDVGIIAPEVSNVDGGGYSYGNTLKSQVWDKMIGFGTHSYGIAMTKDMMDIVGDKDHWETESSGDFAHGPAHILSDINLGITHWFAFYGYRNGTNCGDHCLINWNDGDPVFEPQAHTMLEFAKLLRVGTVMRFCESSMTNDEHYQYMELNRSKGPLPPICAAAGVSSNDAWVIGLSNQSGCAISGQYAWAAYPTTTYDVTVHVEELEGEGDVEFNIRRMKMETGEIVDEGKLTMSNGRLTVPNFVPRTVASLYTKQPVAAGSVSIERERSRRDKVPSLRILQKGAHIRIDFGVDRQSKLRVTLHDLQGKTVRTLADSRFGAGKHRCDLDAREVPPGTYVVAVDLEASGRHQRSFLGLCGLETSRGIR